ncbi:uncharacterized protein SPAPADRAFT_68677 [Spathaspora passalidarum NRRL Y-27907]|uniref:Uncharacterized protein n=1 Tax=Spathaspora passalidarum (strain NRRL Y-27907 / 11-Y1) TaxID=619300 RepID=G3AUP6_SPAPN|nr:uncharacterized protein SPAPADRAFT_68677 [Spathaspora passalidarum NRRL Y-27907]EGW30602.1 hypothetical protein SPAPADRAFT_68677 [Spathaspora passalidarum NRRL Y-27907]
MARSNPTTPEEPFQKPSCTMSANLRRKLKHYYDNYNPDVDFFGLNDILVPIETYVVTNHPNENGGALTNQSNETIDKQEAVSSSIRFDNILSGLISFPAKSLPEDATTMENMFSTK